MNLISFSLYGNDPKYTRGLITNLDIKLRDKLYQDWDVIVYHDNSVKDDILNELKSRKAILRNASNSGIFPLSWRFLANDEPNVERFISRDADSRISKREEEAVLQWIASNKTLHIMRDHPHHSYKILAGMWGMKSQLFNMREEILKHQTQEYVANVSNWAKQTDQYFLADVIYAKYGNPENSIIHAAKDYINIRWANENWAIDFPTVIGKEKYFVGEVFYFDNNGIERRDYQCRER